MKPVEKLFCCAIADDEEWHSRDLKRLYDGCEDKEVFDFAVRNQAASIVGLALRSVMKSEDLPQRWSEAISQVYERLVLYLRELDAIADELDRRGIKLVALKNSGIARGIYPHLAGCPMGDVDALVQPCDFAAADKVITSLGYQTLGANSRGYVALSESGPKTQSDDLSEEFKEGKKSGGMEYLKPLNDSVSLWFELQWRPVAGQWIQPHQEPMAEDLVACSISVKGTKVRILSPVDNLIQVCLHTSKHTYVREPGFRLHTDVDRIVRRTDVEWEEFANRIIEMGVCTAVYFSLIIPHNLLKTPVPEHILIRFKPRRWKEKIMLGWIQRVGLFNPEMKKWSKPGYIFFKLLLFDNLNGVVRAIVPDADTMCQRYNVKSRWMLPWFYALRIWGLAFKRANI